MGIDISQALGDRSPENLIATKVLSPGMARAAAAISALRYHYNWDPTSPNPSNPQIVVSGPNDTVTLENWDEELLGPAPTIDDLIAMDTKAT